MNTPYIDCWLYTYPAAEFFTFYFKLPRFQPLLDSCLHYHFEEGHLVSQKRGNCCFASDLLNSLGSSCHSGCLFSKGMEENLTKHFEWTGLHWKKNGRDKLPPRHTYIDIYIYLYLYITPTSFSKVRMIFFIIFKGFFIMQELHVAFVSNHKWRKTAAISCQAYFSSAYWVCLMF